MTTATDQQPELIVDRQELLTLAALAAALEHLEQAEARAPRGHVTDALGHAHGWLIEAMQRVGQPHPPRVPATG
jgi:hypothetical protein